MLRAVPHIFSSKINRAVQDAPIMFSRVLIPACVCSSISMSKWLSTFDGVAARVSSLSGCSMVGCLKMMCGGVYNTRYSKDFVFFHLIEML